MQFEIINVGARYDTVGARYAEIKHCKFNIVYMKKNNSFEYIVSPKIKLYFDYKQLIPIGGIVWRNSFSYHFPFVFFIET